MADQTGDENDNVINGTSGDDTIRGRGGADTLNGQDGNDTIVGGDGNDNIDGGSGNDRVYGGDGDDTITGGSGDDVIEGGRGNDTMTAGNGSTTDTFVIRDGDGNDTITDFDPGEPDIIAFDMAEINSFQDVLDRISQDGPDTVITYDNGSTTRLTNVDSTSLTSTNFQTTAAPACFHANTLIETTTGPRRVEDLVVGELVLTLSGKARPIVKILAQRLTFLNGDDPAKPILIQAGALAEGLPQIDTILSPQHRLLFDGPEGPILVAAKKLLKHRKIRQMSGRSTALYYNLLLDEHEVIFANGLCCESLLRTHYTDATLPRYAAAMRPAFTISARLPKGATASQSRVADYHLAYPA